MWQHETPPLRQHSWPGVCEPFECEETEVTNIKQLTPPPTKLTFLPCIYTQQLAVVHPQNTHRVATTTFWPTFHDSIMMEKIAQAGEGGGARPSSFTKSTITYKVVVYTLHLRGHIHSPHFYSTPICTLWMHPSKYSCLQYHLRLYDNILLAAFWGCPSKFWRTTEYCEKP